MRKCLAAGDQVFMTQIGETGLAIRDPLSIRERNVGIIEMYGESSHSVGNRQSPFM